MVGPILAGKLKFLRNRPPLDGSSDLYIYRKFVIVISESNKNENKNKAIIENINKSLPPPQPDRTSIMLTTFDTHEMDHFALQTILRAFYN